MNQAISYETKHNRPVKNSGGEISHETDNSDQLGETIVVSLHIKRSTIDQLTHLPLNKMTVTSQMIFSDVFSRMKNFVNENFWSKFHWSLFLEVQLSIIQS